MTPEVKRILSDVQSGKLDPIRAIDQMCQEGFPGSIIQNEFFEYAVSFGIKVPIPTDGGTSLSYVVRVKLDHFDLSLRQAFINAVLAFFE